MSKANSKVDESDVKEGENLIESPEKKVLK